VPAFGGAGGSLESVAHVEDNSLLKIDGCFQAKAVEARKSPMFGLVLLEGWDCASVKPNTPGFPLKFTKRCPTFPSLVLA